MGWAQVVWGLGGARGGRRLLTACAGAGLTWTVAAPSLTGWREPGLWLGHAAKLRQAPHSPQPTGDQELSPG